MIMFDSYVGGWYRQCYYLIEADICLCVCRMQLLLKCETRHFAQGSIIADSREEAKGLIVITSGQVRPSSINNDILV